MLTGLTERREAGRHGSKLRASIINTFKRFFETIDWLIILLKRDLTWSRVAESGNGKWFLFSLSRHIFSWPEREKDYPECALSFFQNHNLALLEKMLSIRAIIIAFYMSIYMTHAFESKLECKLGHSYSKINEESRQYACLLQLS